MLNKTKVKAIAGILVVFLLGTIIGTLGTTAFIFRTMRRFTTEGINTQRTWFMRRLDRQVRLTDEQKPQAKAILEQTEEDVHQLLQRSMAEFADILQHRDEELKTILTPEQQQKLDEMTGRMQRFLPPHVPITDIPE